MKPAVNPAILLLELLVIVAFSVGEVLAEEDCGCGGLPDASPPSGWDDPGATISDSGSLTSPGGGASSSGSSYDSGGRTSDSGSYSAGQSSSSSSSGSGSSGSGGGNSPGDSAFDNAAIIQKG